MWEVKAYVKGGAILQHSRSKRWIVSADRFDRTFFPEGSDGQCSRTAAVTNWREAKRRELEWKVRP